MQPERDETDGEQQHDGVDGEHQPRLLDARHGDRVQVLRRGAERHGVVGDGSAHELRELALDERLALQDRADGVQQHFDVARHRVDALIAAERDEQALELAAANRCVLAGEVERADDELERVRRLAIETFVADLLDDTGAGLAQERDRGGVGALVGDQLARERRGVADGRNERRMAIAEPRFLAGAALHREQRLGKLLRLGGDALEERASAFARRRLLLPRRLERVDECAEVAVQPF